MATQNIPTTNSPKVGSTDGNGFNLRLSWAGTYDDVTGAASVTFTSRLYATNNNFIDWTINSDILANGYPLSDSSVKRTLAKNSSVIIDTGTFTASNWSDWATNNNGATYYLAMTAHADGVGSATYIPENTSVGTTITVTPSSTPPPPTSYTVTFDSQGGSAGTFTRSGTSISLPSPGSRTNYSFDGWWTASSSGSQVSDPYTPSNNTTILYAHWTYVDPGGSTTYYSYGYESNGGSSTPSGSGSIASGTAITLGSPGTKTGFTFAGWYIDSGLTSYAGGVGGSYAITANRTFYAKWSTSTSVIPSWPSPLPTLAQFIAGQAYTDTITASNMSAYNGVYSISAGSLPGGISINSATGELSGTVSTASDYSFTVTARNDNGTATQNYSGTIRGIMRIRQNEAWVKAIAKKREGQIWKPGTVRVWSNGTWLYGS